VVHRLVARALATMSAMSALDRAINRVPSLPIIAIAGAVLTWGFASPLLKYSSLSGPALGFYRLWLGAIVLSAALAVRRVHISPNTLRWAAPAGVVFGTNLVLFVVAVKLTTVANATLIGALQPAIVLLVAGRWFGETVSRREIMAVVVAIVGVGVVIVGSAGKPEWNPAGDALAVLSVLTFTAYFLISKQARATVGTLDYMAVVHIVAALVATPIALAHPGELTSFQFKDVLIVLFFGLVSGTAGQMVIGWAHRYVDVSLSSLMLLAVPIVAALTAWAMLGESLGPVQILGGAITLVAIAAMVGRSSSTVEIAPVPAGVATGGGD
jgi:drug/metabolite transporter (DMT)-like permease